ncbi:malonyl-CoA decarboxylase [Notoacmeibacter sp. MSK16QG-6]|uniref:malonyl-CoA decarboxylase n=1 Tax=Notoacmeibacter sp. MSK16QG-6 TaxID=2957982 RepID=UPI0020A1FAE0|nr:malonyl-CoA decarboxylase [Notoacmeibacter sp. MSK16QG-6]MCP1200347.1 malonyl-CoA decarboxylase [Notoacmeibacter sp. MSK16QG-6]
MSRMSLLSDLLSSLNRRPWFGQNRGEFKCSVDELVALCRKLLRSRGEASGIITASEILIGLQNCDDESLSGFFEKLALDFAPDEAVLGAAAADYAEAPSAKTLASLQAAAESPRQELFRRLNLAPGGTAALVKLRERLLPLVKQNREVYGPVNADFHHLFQSWFNRGFLVLKPIDWNTPAAILEKIIAYEAVHAIDSWDALRARLAPPDRRCFAFFHPAIPDDPLIFVEVALTRDIPASIKSVLSEDRDAIEPENAQTAVFYSISNCHRGLAGVSFGSFLIKQVAFDLKETLPNLKTFVTLSPVPGFARWLSEFATEHPSRLLPNEKEALRIVARVHWQKDGALVAEAENGLLSLAARYFLNARRDDGQPVDSVARFHLGNGAMLNRIMHMADPSPSALRQSHGLMVNYLYDLQRVEQRHEAYASSAEIAASRAVTNLLPARSGQDDVRNVA